MQCLGSPSGIGSLALTVSACLFGMGGAHRAGVDWGHVPYPHDSPGPSWAPYGSVGAESQLTPPTGEEESLSCPTAHLRIGVYTGEVVMRAFLQRQGPER